MPPLGAPLITRLPGHKDSVNALAVDAHGLTLSCSDDRSVRVWALSPARGALSTRLLQGAPEAVGAVTADATAGDERVWAAAGARLLAWDLRDPGVIVRAPAASLLYAGDDISAIALHRGLGQLIAVDDEGSVLFVEAQPPHKLARIVRRAHTSLATCLAVRPTAHGSGSSGASSSGCASIDLVTGGLDNRLLFWDSRSGGLVSVLDTRLMAFDVAPAPVSLAAGRRGGGSRGGGPRGRPAATSSSNSSSSSRGGRRPQPQHAAAAGGGAAQASASASATAPAAASEADAGAGSHQLVNPPFVHAVAFSPDGRHVAAALGNGSVLVVDPDAQSLVCELSGAHAAAAVAVGWVRLGDGTSYLFSAGNDGMLCLWDVGELQQQQQQQQQEGEQRAAAAASDAGGGAPPVVATSPDGGCDGGSGAAPALQRLVWSTRHRGIAHGPNAVCAIDSARERLGRSGTARDGGGLLVCDVSHSLTLYAWP